jgi:SAM-dependent methyltransferase
VTLDGLRRTWDRLGRDDPLWAVLSDPAKRNKGWDTEEFFRTGEAEIAQLFEDVAARGIEVHRGTCLDFGCGVGRVSQALCGYFARVDGVDIAQSMVDAAQTHNRYGDRCQYRLNLSDDLRIFDDATFDFVYSNIVLQHMEPALAEGYIREFMRVLAPNGIAVFQVPSQFRGPTRLPAGAHHAELRFQSGFRPGRLESGVPAILELRVRNTSPAAWPATSFLQIGNHWRDVRRQVSIVNDGRTSLGQDVQPGQEVSVDLAVTPPTRAGRYLLEIDVVEEGVAWFVDRGSRALQADVRVGRATPLARAARLIGLRANRLSDAGTEAVQADPPFEMHAVPKDRVLDAVTSNGGEILGIEDYDVSGPGWENYRYLVRRPSRTE